MKRARDFAVPALAALAAWVFVARPSAARSPVSPTPSSGYPIVEKYARTAEHVTGTPGFNAFANAVARRESKGNPEAHNPGDAKAACRGYDHNVARYGSSPYPRWMFCEGSGGLYGLIPSTALAAEGFEHADPRLIFQPDAATTFLSAFVRRIVTRYFAGIPPKHRNWLTIRRFMAGNVVGLDWKEERVLEGDTDGVPRSVRVRERFAQDLEAVGVPASFMYAPVVVQRWPGAQQLYTILQGKGGVA